MVRKIYPAELQLNKTNSFDTKASFFELAFVHFQLYCFLPKFMIHVTILMLKFSISPLFLDGDVPCSISYGVHPIC